MASLDNFRLTVFRAVASQRSFRKAAEELYLTQPAVSMQIKALEEELGVQLLDRTGTEITLTRAGELLQDYAGRSSALMAEAAAAIAELSGESSGTLALGASTTIAQYVLPRLLSCYKKDHPRANATLISGNTEAIVEAVEQQRISLGMIEGPARSRDVKTEAFLEDELVLIVSSAHEWTEQQYIASSSLAGIPLLLRERGSGTRRVVEMALEKAGLKRGDLCVAMELDSTEAIKSAVEAGLGVGFVSRSALAKDARTGRSFRVVPIHDLQIRREFVLVYSRAAGLHGLAKEFYRYILANTGLHLQGPSRRAAT